VASCERDFLWICHQLTVENMSRAVTGGTLSEGWGDPQGGCDERPSSAQILRGRGRVCCHGNCGTDHIDIAGTRTSGRCVWAYALLAGV